MAEIIITNRKDTEERVLLRAAATAPDGTELSRGFFEHRSSAFGQGNVKALLAGGIGTAVEYRRGGNIRKMFEKMHAEAAQEGVAVALLHPFSFAYYRKFGYEKVADHLIVKFPTRYIDFVPRRCNFMPYQDSMLPDLLRLHAAFARGRNLLLQRIDDSQYKNPERQTYVCYSTYHRLAINHYEDSLLTVHELAYASPEALREIFSFLRMFEGEFDEIEFANVAMCPEVDLLLRNYTHTAYTLLPDIMARVLNTEKMLLAQDYPLQEGAFTLRIEDTLPSVSGIFKVAYGGGECTVQRGAGSPDLTLSASALARLIYGYDGVTAEAAKYMDGVQIDGSAEAFFRAFPKKPCGIFEHF